MCTVSLQLKGKQPYSLYDVELHITVTFRLSGTSRSGKITPTAQFYVHFLLRFAFLCTSHLFQGSGQPRTTQPTIEEGNKDHQRRLGNPIHLTIDIVDLPQEDGIAVCKRNTWKAMSTVL